MNMQSTYQPPAFVPTLDELEALKQLEMGESLTTAELHSEHVPARLVDAGLIARSAAGPMVITESGRELIRRQGH